jgi:hypothetical protein
VIIHTLVSLLYKLIMDEDEHIDPWTWEPREEAGRTGGGVMPFPSSMKQRYVGERIYSYSSNDKDIWGEEGRVSNSATKAWKQWGDFVQDPLASPTDPDYTTRPLRRGAIKHSVTYAEKHTFPNYSQFGQPQLADVFGRQFRWAVGDERNNGRNKLVHIRFPRGSRRRLNFPRPGSTLEMVDLATGHLFSGEVGWIEGDDRPSAATGCVFLYDTADKGPATTSVISEAVRNLPRLHQKRVHIY